MKKTRYVYYKKETGRISSIVTKKIGGKDPFIECDIKDVIGFLDGSVNMMKYVIAYNKDEGKHIIMKKENTIRLRQEGQKLSRIPNKKKETELNIVYHPDNILEFRLCMELITPLYMTDFRNEIRFEKGTEFRIFVNDKNTGEVRKEIIIDAQELLERGTIFIRLPDECYSKNTVFYTYKLLNSYSWCVGKNKVSSPIKDSIKYNIHKADSERKEGFTYHLEIKPLGDGVYIRNNIEDLHLARIHGDLEFFITDYHDPHILFGKFIITEKMLKDKEFSISLDINLNKKAILYNHKYISVLLEI